MEHHELDFGGDDLHGQLEMQVALEADAIARYRNHIEMVGDSDKEVVGVLKHILDEEKRHRKEFRIRLEKF